MSNGLKFKRLFNSIVCGQSSAVYNGVKIFIKHFVLSDQVELDEYYEECFNDAKARGLPTQKDATEQLKRSGFWKESDESEIKTLELYVDRLKQSKSKQSLPSHIEQTQELINKEVAKIGKKRHELESQIGVTCEKFAANKLNSFFIFKSFYADKGLTVPLFSEGDFDRLEDSELSELIVLYNTTINEINTDNIKLISLQPFFHNYFYLTEDISSFWGKPIVCLTNFQTEVSAYGRYFKQLLQNTKDIPEEIRTDPEKLIDFVNSSSNMKKETEEKGENAISMVGATKEDLKAVGMETSNPLAAQARKKKELGLGGLTSIEMQQITEGRMIYS